MRLDAKWLRDKGACEPGIARFIENFPGGLDVSGEPDVDLLAFLARRCAEGRREGPDVCWLEEETIGFRAGEVVYNAVVPGPDAPKDAGWLAILVAIWRHLAAQS